MNLILRKSKFELKRNSDVALIIGDGKTMPQDVMAVSPSLFDIFCIGRSINFGDFKKQHWVNVDGADSRWWAEHLPLTNGGEWPIRHSLGEFDWFDVDWDIENEIKYTPDTQWHGSSSLFSVYVALAMGYTEIILAGCPLDSRGHWWDGTDQPGPEWPGYSYQAWLDFSKTPEARKVRSLSGYTEQILK